LAIGNPADGPFVLTEVRASGGRIATATDDEIRGGIALLASTEGIFAETAGGVTVAVLAKLARDGVIPRHACTVAYITGNGLKTADAMAAASTSVTSLRTLGLALPRPITIAPTIQALEEALAEWAALSA
jgi:threonine synthase